MNKGMIYWLRWSAVIPGAFLAGIIASLLIREVLFYTVFAFFPLNNPVEVMLTPVLNAAGFVFFGSLIAPERSQKSLVTVFMMCMAVIGLLVILNLTGVQLGRYRLQFRNGLISCLMAILGACVGISLVLSRIKRQKAKQRA